MKNLLIIGVLLFSILIPAQRHEIGVQLGQSNIVGDVGKTKYVQLSIGNVSTIPVSIGAFYKRNFNPYQGVKASISYHSVYFDDTKSNEIYKRNRKLSGSNNILEGSLTFEYNFFPINNEVKESTWSPYIFGGVSGISYEIPSIEYTISPNSRTQTGYDISSTVQGYSKRFSGGIPFGVGIKYKFNYNWTISGEVTFRPTFTDDLDHNDVERFDHSVVYKNIPDNKLDEAAEAFNKYIETNKFGNLNSKDWLNSISIGVSYSFGRPPCYCD